ncbi:hypothetical protein H9X54_000760, partial [Flavobacterium macrobrachii]
MAWEICFSFDSLLLAKNTRRDEGWNVGFWLARCTKVHPHRNSISDGIVWWVLGCCFWGLGLFGDLVI